MSDNIYDSPKARWKHLRENGPNVLIDLTSNNLVDEKPEWLDEARFKEAKDAVAKFFIGLSYSSLTGLLLILQLPDGLEPLLTTGNSKDVPSLYKRYLSTILHVNSWYDDDIFDPNTKGYRSIRQVRAMHKRVQQLMNEKFQVKDYYGDDHKWMTQYDVAITQFSFCGLAMLWPTKTAMVAATPYELSLISYYWRVLGYMMGLRDEFNACHFEDYRDIREFMFLVFKNEFEAKYDEQECKNGLEMTKAICLALQYYMPLVTFNSLAHWWNDCFSFNGYELEPLTLKDKLLLQWTDLSFNKLLKNKTFLRYSNKLHRRRFDKRLKKKDAVYEKLTKQYRDCKELTFYSERVDYFSTATNNNNNNNNYDKEFSGVGKHKLTSPVAVTTFKGCPMGYDADLPST